MQIKNTTVVKGFDGEELQYQGQVLTVGRAFAQLLNGVAVEKRVGGLMKTYVLAIAFYTQAESTLDRADVAMLKGFLEVDVQFSALVLGQLYELLEGDEKN